MSSRLLIVIVVQDISLPLLGRVSGTLACMTGGGRETSPTFHNVFFSTQINHALHALARAGGESRINRHFFAQIDEALENLG